MLHSAAIALHLAADSQIAARGRRAVGDQGGPSGSLAPGLPLTAFHLRRRYCRDDLAVWQAAAHFPDPATRIRLHRLLADTHLGGTSRRHRATCTKPTPNHRACPRRRARGRRGLDGRPASSRASTLRAARCRAAFPDRAATKATTLVVVTYRHPAAAAVSRLAMVISTCAPGRSWREGVGASIRLVAGSGCQVLGQARTTPLPSGDPRPSSYSPPPHLL